MSYKYQIVSLGEYNRYGNDIIASFLSKIEELGLSKDCVSILTEQNFFDDYRSNAPTVALYFGYLTSSFRSEEILEILLQDSVFILPIVDSLENFQSLIPKSLHAINGFELKSKQGIEALINRLLECLSLLRLSRRLFISYRRKESRAVAIQLYEYLDQCGFDVFLDTHSILPGEPFQEELWHRLVDTDVVVLLNTPGFLGSEWTKEELAKASAMSIGIIQLIWPKHHADPFSALCFPSYLEEANFEFSDFDKPTSHLVEGKLDNIRMDVESLRARSLAARQDNLIKEFMATAKDFNVTTYLQPQKFITVIRKSDNKELALIPTIGVPHAFTYQQIEDLIKTIRTNHYVEILLLYDHRNIREKWLMHLTWLDQYLPVKAIKITEIDSWLKKL